MKRLAGRGELRALFAEGVGDCGSEQEKERRARELVGEFGEAKLLAILIRRAKKRCRPLWWTVVARSFQATVAAVVFFVLYVVWFYRGEAKITTNYVVEPANVEKAIR